MTSYAVPLSTLLSRLLVAFTIELDNEFEHRFTHAGGGARVASVVMWSNFLRFVGDGIAVGELPGAGTPKPRALSTLGGMERWRYVYVAPTTSHGPPTEKRDGYGSGRGLDSEWVVQPTPAGRTAAAIWPLLFDEIERRWDDRFGAQSVGGLRSSLASVVKQVDAGLPEFLPILVGGNGMALDLPPNDEREPPTAHHLAALLSKTLVAYTLDFERASSLSLPLRANVIRVLDEDGVLVRDLPRLSGTSKEAAAMALTFLAKTDYVLVEGSSAATKRARLTPSGLELRDGYDDLHSAIEKQWKKRFGRDEVPRLRASLEHLNADPNRLARGLEPYPEGWRASKQYLARTQAVLADAHAALPHYPMVLHRGGWPDGS